MKNFFSRANLPRLCLIAATAVLITAAGILFQQSPLRILPLYISLFVVALQSQANRYASLIGGCNTLLYAVVYACLGLYASAAYAVFFSCPIQIATFIRWNRNKYGTSTRFRRLSRKNRILIGIAFLLCFGILFVVLKAADSSHQLLDNVVTLLGLLISILTMYACIEYTWLMLPSGILGLFLHIATAVDHPAQITYVIFMLYSIICTVLQFFRVRKLYRQQLAETQSGAAETEIPALS